MALLPDTGSRQDGLYAEATGMYGAALDRLARAYEPDADRLVQSHGAIGALKPHRWRHGSWVHRAP